MKESNIIWVFLALLLSSFTVSKDDFNVKYLIGEAQQQSLLYYNSLLSNEQIHHHLYTNNHNTHLRRRLNEIPRSNINTTTITTYPRTTTLNRTPANPTNTRGAATNTTLHATPSTINNKEIQNKVGNPISFKETKHPEKGPVIAVLLANREKDIEELCLVLRSLVLLKGDKDKEHLAPVLVFQEGDISDTAKQFLVRCTNRLIAFPYVNFTAFPADFDMKIEGERFEIKGRSQWGYYQMIRFWVTRIWEHPALNPFETIMRIDSDSCFNEVNEYLPNFKHDHLMYHSQYVGLEDGKKYVLGLLDFAEEYLKKVQRVPKNVLLWDFIKTTWAFHQTLPLFMTNMEVSSKSFMLRPEIKSWHRALTEQEPFGVMRKRWGDADIRFLTAAMFMGHDEVLTERASGYRHKERCLREEIEAAIKSVSGVTDA